MLVQNYGWPTGPAKIWLWLARRPFGWPRATGPAGSTTPDNIYRTEEIPQTWRQGKIIRIYKGKGKKGLCSNERGITLSSNLGKLFERIINNKILGKINMSQCQGGGKKRLFHI